MWFKKKEPGQILNVMLKQKLVTYILLLVEVQNDSK